MEDQGEEWRTQTRAFPVKSAQEEELNFRPFAVTLMRSGASEILFNAFHRCSHRALSDWI